MISIIIPVYNVAAYIDKCISSVVEQTYTEWECILVNDGSTDASGKRCDEWVQKDSRIKVLHQENKGVSVARNNGIGLAQGEYITFIDSDDWVKKTYLQELIHEIGASNFDIIVSGITHINKDKIQIINKPAKNETIRIDNRYTTSFIKNIGLLYGPTSKLYKKEIIIKNIIKFPEERSLGEDIIFNFKYLKHTKEIRFIAKSNYHYRVFDAGNLTNIRHKNLFELLYGQWKFQIDFFKEKGMWNDVAQFHMFKRLWGIVYDCLFTLYDPEINRIKTILSIVETESLEKYKNDFQCAEWIKYLILKKRYILLYFILTAKTFLHKKERQ